MYVLLVSCGIWGTDKNAEDFFFESNKDILYSQNPTEATYTISINGGRKTLFTYLSKYSSSIRFALELDTNVFVIISSDTNDTPIFISYSGSSPSWSCKITSGEILGILNPDSSWHITGSDLKADSTCDNSTYSFEGDFVERN